MSSTTTKLPYIHTGSPTITSVEAATQGLLLSDDGYLATKGTGSGQGDSKTARFIAKGSAAAGAKLGVITSGVITNASIAASGTNGAAVYLGAAGAITLVTPVSVGSAIKQTVGYVFTDPSAGKVAYVSLPNSTVTTL